MVLVISLSLLSAACYGIGSVFQHQAAEAEPPALALRADLLLRLARHPRWLVGTGGDAVGFLLQLFALRTGSVTLVEPLLVTSLLFAFPVAAIMGHRRVSITECASAVAVAAGLGLFLGIGDPSQTSPHAPLRVLLVLTGLAAITIGILVTTARVNRGRHAAICLAAGTGIAFGYMAAMTSIAWHAIDHDFIHVFRSWEVGAMIVSGAVGIALTHSAFGSGKLRFSLPTMTVAQPLVAVLIGLLGLHERIDWRSWHPLLELVGLVAVITGVYVLALAELPTLEAASPGLDGTDRGPRRGSIDPGV